MSTQLNFIEVNSQGADITYTNYWETEMAEKGFLYLSVAARTIRLLVPPSQLAVLAEMKTAKEIIIYRGPWKDHGNRDALEIVFEDYTETPYLAYLVAEQVERMPADNDQGKVFKFAIWTTTGKVFESFSRYKKLKVLPSVEDSCRLGRMKRNVLRFWTWLCEMERQDAAQVGGKIGKISANTTV